MKKILKGLVITLLFAGLLNLIVFTPSVSAVENLPTVWVKIYRIQQVDTIENILLLEDGADWRYEITVSDGENLITQDFKCTSNNDDIVVDRVDSFTDLTAEDVSVVISLYEDDLLDAETADISGSGTSFNCIYNIASNELSGDETVIEGEYHKTSGDYDGSLETDENDANLWFAIYDNYDAPVAKAGEDQTAYTAEKVNFDGSLSTASNGSSIVKFEWDFENDGIIDAEDEKTSYTYSQKGAQTCRLIVTDSIGVLSEDTCIVNVLNRGPIAEFTFSPLEPTIRDEMHLVDTSTDPDGTITSWFWYFGDGTTSTLESPTKTFNEKGEWLITLTVTDSDGAENSTTHTVVVVNLPPEASFECTPDPRTDSDVQFTDKSIDPENMSLSWLWDFGDGYTSELQNPMHKFTDEGNYDVILTVKDDENATDTFSMSLSVTEPPPPETDDSIPLWIIGVVVIVVSAIGILSVLLWNRHRERNVEFYP
jgi:PKD repeat protein